MLWMPEELTRMQRLLFHAAVQVYDGSQCNRRHGIAFGCFSPRRFHHVKTTQARANVQSLELQTTPETKDQVQRRLLLDVVVRKCATIFQLFPSEDQSLLVGRDTFFVLNLCFHIDDGVRSFHIKGDGLTGQGLHLRCDAGC
jgi:hypothetical protein